MRERTLVVAAISLLCCLNAYATDADVEQEGYQPFLSEEQELFNECAPIRVRVSPVIETSLLLAVQKTIVDKLRNAGIEAEGHYYEEEGILINWEPPLPVNSKGVSTTDVLRIKISLSRGIDTDRNRFIEGYVRLSEGFDIELDRLLPTGYGNQQMLTVWHLNGLHRGYIYGSLLGWHGLFDKNYDDINYVLYLLEKEVDFFITLYLSVNREYCEAQKEEASE